MGGVATLVGTADGTTPAAALYSASDGAMLGDVWEAIDAYEQIEAFLEWLRQLRHITAVDTGELELDPRDMPRDDGNDPRMWPQDGLIKAMVFWRKQFVDEETGLMKEPVEA